jgi:hypothetical protein
MYITIFGGLALAAASACSSGAPVSDVERQSAASTTDAGAAARSVIDTDACRTACSAASSDDRSKVVCYSCKCKEALGALPTPEELRASSADVIKTYRVVERDGRLEEQEIADRATECENPALLPDHRNACLPGSRLGQLRKGRAYFKWIFRKKQWRADWATDGRYDDFGIIGYNPDTGATCFWDDRDGRTAARDGAGDEIADIDLTGAESEKIDAYLAQFYHTDGEGCARCHDADPFLGTNFLLRSIDWDSNTPRRIARGPYARIRAVGEAVAVGNLALTIPADATGDAAQARRCTSCHRLASGDSCENFVLDSLGIRRGDRPYQALVRPAIDDADASGRAYPYNVWMPPRDTETWADHAAWLDSFGGARAYIRGCCEARRAPGAGGCAWSPIPGGSVVGTLGN